MLKFSGISKSYSDNLVIDNLSEIVKPGEIIALLGPSGSGKSTLLKILSLLESVDYGSIKLNGVEKKYSKSPIDDYHPSVTMVFQQLYLWPHLTMLDNIMLSLRKNPSGYSSETEDKLSYLIDHFELQNYLSRYPNQLSVGQRQRIALIRALVLNPKFLLLDEITSSLDIEHIQKVKHVLNDEKLNGTGIIIATHLIGLAKSIADRFWFIEGGVFVEKGAIDQIKDPTTQRLNEYLSLID